jgi:hypothetical protein
VTRRVFRLLLYAAAGALVGFLVLGEFGLRTFAPLLILLALLALSSLAGALSRNESLSAWAPFLLAAMIAPLIIDVGVVGLPRCGEVAAGVACVASNRDYQTPFWLELVVFTIAATAVAVNARRTAHA